MASTCSFVGATAPMRARVTARRGRAQRASVAPRAETSAVACAVTPATVQQRSGSATVKGTSRKQNEDRFASYVRRPSSRAPRPSLPLFLSRARGGVRVVPDGVEAADVENVIHLPDRSR